jgi:riboflavin-specific deaminase-like protein
MTPPMGQPLTVQPGRDEEQDAWMVVRAAARRARTLGPPTRDVAFALDAGGELCEHAGTGAVVAWRAGGWTPLVADDDARRALLELYLPIASATPLRPMVVGHLGQSLDGFIATNTGDSQFVTGPENIVHLHRMRALCDAVIVGAGTVAADDPQLTTRHVEGESPLRVVFDPSRRLTAAYRVFRDAAAPTLYACARSRAGSDTHVGEATLVALDEDSPGSGVLGLVRELRDRGCHRIFVEGGGVTVSAFLEADVLDRLHVAIAPLIIGSGRPAIRLAGRDALRDCRRPQHRLFRMGGDVLFDCDLREPGVPQPSTGVSRVV